MVKGTIRDCHGKDTLVTLVDRNGPTANKEPSRETGVKESMPQTRQILRLQMNERPGVMRESRYWDFRTRKRRDAGSGCPASGRRRQTSTAAPLRGKSGLLPHVT